MEAEALLAIFDTAVEIISDTQPFEWSVKLVPVDCGGDEEEEEAQNHVAVKLIAKIPLDYPEMSLPELDVQIVKVRCPVHTVCRFFSCGGLARISQQGETTVYANACYSCFFSNIFSLFSLFSFMEPGLV